MQWAPTVAVEIAHLGTDRVLHGHSLTIEAWTDFADWHGANRGLCRLVLRWALVHGCPGSLTVTG